MFSKDEKKIDTLEGFKLKHANLSVPLYKYCKIDKYSLANLENETVWLSNAANFNDPYDSALSVGSIDNHHKNFLRDSYEKIALNLDIKVEDVQRVMDGRPIESGLTELLGGYSPFKNNPEIIAQAVEKFLKETELLFEEYAAGISDLYQRRIFATCFSEDPTSMLMWSHYANNHEGMVLKYELVDIDIEKHRDIFMWLNPIIYTDELLSVEDYESVRDKMSISTLAAISKSKEWSYEKEWRLIVHEKSEEQGFPVKFLKPSCIIVGARASKADKIMLSLEAMKKEIPIKKIKLDKAKYRLSIQEFKKSDLL